MAGNMILILCGLYLVGNILEQNQVSVKDYEVKTYHTSVYSSTLKIDELCVSDKDVSSEHFNTDDEFHAILLFNTNEAKVMYAENIHERLYPASTTKILTTYLALKYGNQELQYHVLIVRVLLEMGQYDVCYKYLMGSGLWKNRKSKELLSDERNYLYYTYARCFKEHAYNARCK